MSVEQAKKPKLPVILYEEPKPGDTHVNPIPYIEIGLTDEMPKVLFISEYRETGEYEIDTGFGQQAIVDMIIHKFVDFEHLKSILKPKDFDKIRVALGMLPLKQAQKKSAKVMSRIEKNAKKNRETLLNSEEARTKRAFVLGEDLRVKADNFLKSKNDEEEE